MNQNPSSDERIVQDIADEAAQLREQSREERIGALLTDGLRACQLWATRHGGIHPGTSTGSDHLKMLAAGAWLLIERLDAALHEPKFAAPSDLETTLREAVHTAIDTGVVGHGWQVFESANEAWHFVFHQYTAAVELGFAGFAHGDEDAQQTVDLMCEAATAAAVALWMLDGSEPTGTTGATGART